MTPHPLDDASWPTWSTATALPPPAPFPAPGLERVSRPAPWPEPTAADTRAAGLVGHVRGDQLARQVARAAGSFEHGLLGRAPTSVTVVGGLAWMVVHLHEPFSALERRLAGENEAGAVRVRDFHHGLFERTVGPLLEHVRAVTGVPLCAGIAHVDVATGSILKTLATVPDLDMIELGRGLPGLGVPVNEHRRCRAERLDGGSD